jgi:hypothetical protein
MYQRVPPTFCRVRYSGSAICCFPLATIEGQARLSFALHAICCAAIGHAEVIVKWAVETYKPKELILFGQSDGAMLATALALRLVANDATVCCMPVVNWETPAIAPVPLVWASLVRTRRQDKVRNSGLTRIVWSVGSWKPVFELSLLHI